MKFLIFIFSVALFAGCATQKQVAQMEGHGKVQVFPAPFDQTWRAAIDASQAGGLQVISADRSAGYISAHRGMTFATHGENVGIWVKPVSPQETQVEVVSRQAMLPKFWMKNWEKDIMAALNANLTREATGSPAIREPAGVEQPTRPVAPLPPPPPPRSL